MITWRGDTGLARTDRTEHHPSTGSERHPVNRLLSGEQNISAWLPRLFIKAITSLHRWWIFGVEATATTSTGSDVVITALFIPATHQPCSRPRSESTQRFARSHAQILCAPSGKYLPHHDNFHLCMHHYPAVIRDSNTRLIPCFTASDAEVNVPLTMTAHPSTTTPGPQHLSILNGES